MMMMTMMLMIMMDQAPAEAACLSEEVGVNES